MMDMAKPVSRSQDGIGSSINRIIAIMPKANITSVRMKGLSGLPIGFGPAAGAVGAAAWGVGKFDDESDINQEPESKGNAGQLLLFYNPPKKHANSVF
ncbi:MAG: hypothetical protein DHS20C02_01190 [Micavibrio sp.]|nr:MAG: hypothetical protein DHS20C02_01190 [Micavibrio sp.]